MASSPPPAATPCENCGQVASFTCMKCKLSRYCSAACQRLAWQGGHKFDCLTPEVRANQAALQSGVRALVERFGDPADGAVADSVAEPSKREQMRAAKALLAQFTAGRGDFIPESHLMGSSADRPHRRWDPAGAAAAAETESAAGGGASAAKSSTAASGAGAGSPAPRVSCASCASPSRVPSFYDFPGDRLLCRECAERDGLRLYAEDGEGEGVVGEECAMTQFPQFRGGERACPLCRSECLLVMYTAEEDEVVVCAACRNWRQRLRRYSAKDDAMDEKPPHGVPQMRRLRDAAAVGAGPSAKDGAPAAANASDEWVDCAAK